jgi:hypothetical protein
VPAFAEHVGVSTPTLSHWESRERVDRLSLANEDLLDRALTSADDHARARFLQLREHSHRPHNGASHIT